MTSADTNPTPPEPSRYLHDALSYLTGEGRSRSAERLLEDLHERFREAGLEKLSDLVYEMTKACLSAFPDFAVRVELNKVPRTAEVISGEMRTMSESMRGVSEPVDISGVTRSTPESEHAIEDAHKCLDVLERLEGRTDRHQLACALYHIYQGQPAEAEPLLRGILDRSHLSDEMRWYGLVNLAFSLHRQGRGVEAIPMAEAALELMPDRPPGYFNLIAAAADVGDRDVFARGVRRLCALQRASPSTLIRSWLESDLDRLAERVGVTSAEVDEMTRLAPGPREES